MKTGDKVLCIKTVIMNRNEREAFTEGKEYEVLGVEGSYYCFRNNQKEEHYWPKDAFSKHFKEKEEPMYKIGDKARVKSGLIEDQRYNDIRCNDEMADMAGQTLEIDQVTEHGYHVKENNWHWSREMLEPMFKPGDHVVPMPGMKNDKYTITSYRPDTISEIVSIRDNGKLELKPVKNYPSYHTGCPFDVESKYFKLWEGEPMYRPGDKAKVKSGLIAEGRYGEKRVRCSPEMVEMTGQIVTIKKNNGYGYDVEETYWTFTDDMLERIDTMVKCDSVDCVNNKEGMCQTTPELRGTYVSKDSEDVYKACQVYAKRENPDKELWEKTLNEKFLPAKKILDGLVDRLKEKCPLCHKYIYVHCAGCPWKEVFGRCIKDDSYIDYDGKIGELIETVFTALKLTREITSGIREQINKS